MILLLLTIQWTLKESILDKIHAISKIALTNHYLIDLSPLGNHTIYQEILLLLIKLPKEKRIAEIESDHDLSPLLLESSLAEADRLATRIKHAICLGTHTDTVFADCLQKTLPTPSWELCLTNFLVQEGIVLVLAFSTIAILKES